MRSLTLTKAGRRVVRGFLVGIVLFAASAQAESLKRGDRAPGLSAPGVSKRVAAADGDSSKAMTLVFVKPGDAHAQQAIDAVKGIHKRYPHLGQDSKTVVVVCRLSNGIAWNSDDLPKDWSVLEDGKDSLYSAFKIIATPSVAIVGKDGIVVGYHPGYSPALANAIRADLIRAIDGDSVADATTPTPGIMKVQMGRRLAERKLWDRALEYYRSAAAEEALPPDILLEEVAILLEVGNAAEATKLLDSLGNSATDTAKVAALRARAEGMKSGQQATTTPKPPSPK